MLSRSFLFLRTRSFEEYQKRKKVDKNVTLILYLICLRKDNSKIALICINIVFIWLASNLLVKSWSMKTKRPKLYIHVSLRLAIRYNILILPFKKKISLTKLSKLVNIKQNKYNKSCYLYKYKKLTFPCLIPLHKVIDIVKYNLQNIENTYKHFLNLWKKYCLKNQTSVGCATSAVGCLLKLYVHQ